MRKFIEENRNEFDELKAPATLWNTIEEKLEKKDSERITNRYLAIAASIIMMFSLGYFIGNWQKTPDSIEEVQLQKINSYKQFVNEKRKGLYQKSFNKELSHSFENDFKELENNYNSLGEELDSSPNKNAILNAMIQNLEWQIELLNRQNEILENLKSLDHEIII